MAVIRAGGVLPVDRLLALYNGLLAAIWLALAGRVPWALAICLAHGAAASLPWLRAHDRAAGRGIRVLLGLYPLVWLLAFWTELGLLRFALHDRTYDAAVTALDAALFGANWNLVWMPAMPWPWLSELMHFSYFAYYALIFVPPLVLALAGRRDTLRDVTFRLMVSYLACYLVYLLAPVDGPMHTMPQYNGPLADGFFYRMVHAVLDGGDSLGTAFPSSHVVGAITIVLVGRRWFGRWTARLLALEAVGVTLSTVYTQNHFAVDVVAGVALALVLQRYAVPALERVLRGAAHAPRRTPSMVTPDLVGDTSAGGTP